jgi:hypothetical protein
MLCFLIYIFAEKFVEKIDVFFTENAAVFLQNLGHDIGFWVKRQILSPKIGENRWK